MKLFRSLMATAVLGGTVLAGSTALAADHLDSPAVQDDPASDITDLYAWMSSDGEDLNLALNIGPLGSQASFSDAVQYVFHVQSLENPGDTTPVMTTIICEFPGADMIQCWAGDSVYVAGDPSSESGITDATGDVRVFAGPRNDPFFMEFNGFNDAVDTTIAAATADPPAVTADAAGCFNVNAETSGVLVSQLQGSATDDGNPSDTFAGSSVLSLVMQVDVDLVNTGGPILGVWASTRTAQ